MEVVENFGNDLQLSAAIVTHIPYEISAAIVDHFPYIVDVEIFLFSDQENVTLITMDRKDIRMDREDITMDDLTD
jgi:hypothetical protein